MSPILTDGRPPLGADGPTTLVRLFAGKRNKTGPGPKALPIPSGAVMI